MTAPVKHASLAEALAAFQLELPHVTKGSINPAFKSKYADLADITLEVAPVLAKHGLAWTALPTLTDSGFVLDYRLIHDSEVLNGIYPLPDPAGASAQQLGSAITYARRYALCAVTGIAPDGDDDGNAASQIAAGPARKSGASRPVSRPVKPSRDWEAAINDCEGDPDKLRDLYRSAADSGELALTVDGEPLGAVLTRLGKAATESSEPAVDEQTGEVVEPTWETAPIPADEEVI